MADAFAVHRRDGLRPGRIVRVDRGRCDVVTESGLARVLLSGLRRSDPLDAPCTGDWAALRSASAPAPDPDPDPYPAPDPDPDLDPDLAPDMGLALNLGVELELVALLPRRSAIVRSSASRSSHGQVLAANVDLVIIAVSLAASVDPARLERLLALAWESGAQPLIALTKVDLIADADAVHAETRAVAPGLDVLAVSAETGQGIDELRASIGGTAVLLGSSGAGKSTLANALLGEEVLATGEVRAQDGKGRHTTVRRELVALPGGGVLIDTPGLRGISLYDAAEGLEQVFADIEHLAAGCRFADCAHDSEPGCAVQAAISAGELAGRRLASYRKLQRENDWATSRTDARLRGELTDRQKAITSHLRATYRFRDRQL
jgi:ribosome biogenesis GTPase